jgi:uncharacterized protein GlcG (DUF336 family)
MNIAVVDARRKSREPCPYGRRLDRQYPYPSAFDIETAQLAKTAQLGQQYFGIHGSNNGRVMLFAGDIPLQRNGSVVGAIGVSGGSGDQDQAVATTGVTVFN